MLNLLSINTNADAISAIQSNFGSRDAVLLREPICQGNEEHIFDCDVNPFPDIFCDSHLSDAAVFCDGRWFSKPWNLYKALC